jgi:hypothetical protein
MKLKHACQISTVIVVVSMLLMLAGQAVTYFPIFRNNFHMSNVVNMILPLSASLLQFGGILLFLMAFASQLKTSRSQFEVIIAGGIMVLLGTLITTGTTMTHIVYLFKHYGLLRFISFMTSNGLLFLSGLVLSIFIFVQQKHTSAAKGLAATTIALTLALLVFLVINVGIFIFGPSQGHRGMNIFGYVLNIAGYTGKMVAVLVFMFAFLNTLKKRVQFSEEENLISHIS